MKKLIVSLLMIIFLIGCGAETRQINGKQYEPQGLFTMNDKDPNIKYKVSISAVVWSTIFFPVGSIIFLGWYLWEPEREKYEEEKKE